MTPRMVGILLLLGVMVIVLLLSDELDALVLYWISRNQQLNKDRKLVLFNTGHTRVIWGEPPKARGKDTLRRGKEHGVVLGASAQPLY